MKKASPCALQHFDQKEGVREKLYNRSNKKPKFYVNKSILIRPHILQILHKNIEIIISVKRYHKNG